MLNMARDPAQWHCLLRELPEGDPFPRRTVLMLLSFLCCPSSCTNLPAVRRQGSPVHKQRVPTQSIAQASFSQLPRTPGTANAWCWVGDRETCSVLQQDSLRDEHWFTQQCQVACPPPADPCGAQHRQVSPYPSHACLCFVTTAPSHLC